MSSTFHDSMWATASADQDAERSDRLVAMARVACAPTWPFLAAAGTPDEYAQRKALAADRLTAAIEAVAGTEPGVFQALSSAVLTSLDADFETLHIARARAAVEGALAALQSVAYKVDTSGGKFYVFSSDGSARLFGPFDTKQAAQDRCDKAEADAKTAATTKHMECGRCGHKWNTQAQYRLSCPNCGAESNVHRASVEAYTKGVDCAKSGTGVKADQVHDGKVTCPGCKQSVPASVDSDGYATLYTHLLPGKTKEQRRGAMVNDADHAVLDAAWEKAFSDLKGAGLEADADHPIAKAYRDASDAVNHANRSRDYNIATGQPTAAKSAAGPVPPQFQKKDDSGSAPASGGSQVSARDLKVGQTISGDSSPISKVDTTTTAGQVAVWIGGNTAPKADHIYNQGDPVKVTGSAPAAAPAAAPAKATTTTSARTEDPSEVKVIDHLEPMKRSPMGNPRYRVHFTDGTSAPTHPNSMFAYALDGRDHIGVPVSVSTNGRGHITNVTPVKKTSLFEPVSRRPFAEARVTAQQEGRRDCPMCDGEGHDDQGGVCPGCEGEGTVPTWFRNEDVGGQYNAFDHEGSLRMQAEEHGGYHLEQHDGGWFVVNHIGERKNSEPKSHDDALAYQRALMVNVPGAKDDAERHEENGDQPKHSSLRRQAGFIAEAEYHYVKKRGDKWVIIQKDTGKTLSTHDSEEDAKASFRAMMQSKHGSNPVQGLAYTDCDVCGNPTRSRDKGGVYSTCGECGADLPDDLKERHEYGPAVETKHGAKYLLDIYEKDKPVRTESFDDQQAAEKRAAEVEAAGHDYRGRMVSTSARDESWGSYQHGETGQMIHMHRGNHNKTRFLDDDGNQVGPEHSNIAPAAAWALSNGYHDPDLAAAGIFPDRPKTSAKDDDKDAWGRPLMQPGDGHGAWACNNYDCTDHPASMYPDFGKDQKHAGVVVTDWSDESITALLDGMSEYDVLTAEAVLAAGYADNFDDDYNEEFQGLDDPNMAAISDADPDGWEFKEPTPADYAAFEAWVDKTYGPGALSRYRNMGRYSSLHTAVDDWQQVMDAVTQAYGGDWGAARQAGSRYLNAFMDANYGEDHGQGIGSSDVNHTLYGQYQSWSKGSKSQSFPEYLKEQTEQYLPYGTYSALGQLVPEGVSGPGDGGVYRGGECPWCAAPGDQIAHTADPATNPLTGVHRYICNNCGAHMRGEAAAEIVPGTAPYRTSSLSRCASCSGSGLHQGSRCADCSGVGVVAVNTDAFGTDRYQRTPSPARPGWITDEEDERADAALTDSGRAASPGSNPVVDARSSVEESQIIRDWLVTHAATQHQANPYSPESNPYTTTGPGNPNTQAPRSMADDKADQPSANPATVPTTTHPRAIPGGGDTMDPATDTPADAMADNQRDLHGGGGRHDPASNNATTQNVSVGVHQARERFTTPSPAQAIIAKVSTMTDGVLATNPGLGQANARALAVNTLLAYPAMLKIERSVAEPLLRQMIGAGSE